MIKKLSSDLAELKSKPKNVDENEKINSLFDKFECLENKIVEVEETCKEAFNDILSENNEKVMDVVNEVKSVMKKDAENIHEIIKSDQESNILKISELAGEMNAMTESFHNKMEENFNLLVSRMDNDSKNTESLKDGQDVEVS